MSPSTRSSGYTALDIERAASARAHAAAAAAAGAFPNPTLTVHLILRVHKMTKILVPSLALFAGLALSAQQPPALAAGVAAAERIWMS